MAAVIQQTLDTAIGTVEYCDIGTGEPILYFHGTGAGNEAVILLERALLDSGYRLIVPNRPGYFGTTLGPAGSVDFCAELASHLLDHLQLSRVTVIGTSGGGMPAAQFAAKFPDRTAALILQCAQAHRWDDAIWLPQKLGHFLWLFQWRIFYGLLRWQNRKHANSAKRSPLTSLKHMAGTRFSELQNDADVLNDMAALAELCVQCAAQPAGVQNDWAILVGDNDIAPNTIAAPTLIIHDRDDPLVPYAHAKWSYRCIPQSQLLDIHAGGHLIWHGSGALQMHESRMAFINQAKSGSSS